MAGAFIPLFAVLLTGLILFILDLGLSFKGKVMILGNSTFIGLIGLLGSQIYPLYITVLFQVVLALLISFLAEKKFRPYFLPAEMEKEEPEFEPLFSLDDLAEKASRSETLDDFYLSASAAENETADFGVRDHFSKSIESEFQQEPAAENAEILLENEYQTKTAEAGESIVERVSDFIDLEYKDQERIIENFFSGEIERKPETAAAVEAVVKEEIDLHAALAGNEQAKGASAFLSDQINKPDSFLLAELEVDAERLMKARMEREPNAEASEVSGNNDIEEIGDKAAPFPKSQFDDLEEFYLKRRNKKDS